MHSHLISPLDNLQAHVVNGLRKSVWRRGNHDWATERCARWSGFSSFDAGGERPNILHQGKAVG